MHCLSSRRKKETSAQFQPIFLEIHVDQRVGVSILVCKILLSFRVGSVLQNYQDSKFLLVQKHLGMCTSSLRALRLRQDLEDEYSENMIHGS